MIDQKLPRHLRDTVPVLDSGGRVAAVAELGPDAAFLPRLGEPCWHITAKRKGEYFMLEKDIQEILFSEEQLAQRVKEIAGEINRDYVGQEIMLVSVLRGSFVFMADLCRRIDLPCTVDFMAVSSYGGGHLLQRPGADHQGPVQRHRRGRTSSWWRISWTAETP